MNSISTNERFSIFSNVPAPFAEAFFAAGISRKYPKNDFVTHRGDVWPYLLYITSGTLEAIKESTQGRSFVVETFQPGEFFWGIALFEGDKPNPVAIRAAEDSEILIWDKSKIQAAIVENPEFAWSLFSLLALKMDRVSELLEGLVFLPLASRLANLLIDQSKEAVAEYISRDLTLDDMAARIGTTREMVCKILYKFSDQGILQLERTQFKITDIQQLESLAKSSK
ncbi:Crp/Fnr family transcriptional regulator [bacterium]|nr:Crp/Fnr family transcriptional regulator [bacterium]